VRTRELSYLISPPNTDGFITDYFKRRTLGPILPWQQSLRLPPLFSLAAWRDRLLGLLLGPGLVINVALFGYLATRYPNLPLRMILQLMKPQKMLRGCWPGIAVPSCLCIRQTKPARIQAQLPKLLSFSNSFI
jgi:hypothetical protein